MAQFDTIEEALADLRSGKIILVTDDPDRENEAILSVRPNMQLPPMSISWRPMAKD